MFNHSCSISESEMRGEMKVMTNRGFGSGGVKRPAKITQTFNSVCKEE